MAASLDWDHLRIVLAIRNGGSLQAAATGLGLDRATVVRRLDALEASLGARLFDRRRNGCILSPAGQEIIETVENVSRAVTAVQNRVGGADRRPGGTVAVALPEFMASNVVVPELARLRRRHPEIAINLVTGFDFLNLAQGAADIALRNHRPERHTLVARRIGTGGLAFYATAGYLAQRGAPDDSFAGHDLILPHEDALRLPLFANAAAIAAPGNVVLRVNELGPALTAAKNGLGLALLPCSFEIRNPDLVPVRPGLVARTDSFLVTHRDLRKHARIRLVMDFIAQICAEKAAAISGGDIEARLGVPTHVMAPACGQTPSPDRQTP